MTTLLETEGLEQYADRVELPDSAKSIRPLILDVLKRVLKEQGTWRFKVGTVYGDTVTSFRVFQDRELLGSFEMLYHGREYKVHVINDRIRNKLSRGRGYKTVSAEKAAARILKEFGSKTVSELVVEAFDKSVEIVYRAYRNKSNDIRGEQHPIHTMAHEYIRGPGFPLFIAYVEGLDERTRKEVGDRMDKIARHKTEMLTIEKVKTQLDNQQVALVIRDNGEYIVRLGQNVVIHTDSTLPEHIRGKLGMLKLVEPEHFVTDMGCRINDEVFVIVTEKEDRNEAPSSQA